jgi:DNA-binding MarR family transcriptional regulator
MNPANHLTHRQQQFLRALLELYQKHNQPIHYTQVAERLGVGSVTSYEMLRLLEERDLLEREFGRHEDEHRPGRSPVSFRPTDLAFSTLREAMPSAAVAKEWIRVRNQILGKLRKGKIRGYDAYLKELLRRLPHQRSPLAYLAEMITAVVLGLHSLREVAEAHHLRALLKKIGLPGEWGLHAIPGLSVGLSLVDRFNQRIAEVLLNQTGRYQALLSGLGAEKRRLLAEFTREVVEIVGG